MIILFVVFITIIPVYLMLKPRISIYIADKNIWVYEHNNVTFSELDEKYGKGNWML